MRPDLLQRLLAIARKTGERIVVADGDDAFVLVPLDAYETMTVPAASSRAPRPAAAGTVQPLRDPVETVNREMAAIADSEKVRRAEAIAALLEQADMDTEEDRFYLEPVE